MHELSWAVWFVLIAQGIYEIKTSEKKTLWSWKEEIVQEHPTRQGPWFANLCRHEEQMWPQENFIVQVNKCHHFLSSCCFFFFYKCHHCGIVITCMHPSRSTPREIRRDTWQKLKRVYRFANDDDQSDWDPHQYDWDGKEMMMKKRQMVKMIRKAQRKMIFRSVKDIDLYTGGLAETPVSGAVIGPTFLVSSTVEILNLLFFLLFWIVLWLCCFQCIVGKQFKELSEGDRWNSFLW